MSPGGGRRVLGGRSAAKAAKASPPNDDQGTGWLFDEPPAPSAPAKGDGEPGTRLGELLVDKGLVSPSQLSQALLQQEASGKRVGELLVELGAVNERDMVEVLAMQLVIPLVDFRREEPDPAAVQRLPEAVARATGAIPIRLVGDRLDVATSDPLDQAKLDQISRHLGDALQVVLASPSDILQAIDRSYRALAGMDRHVQAFEAGAALRRGTVVAPQGAAGDGPIAEAVDSIITQALRDRASDIHLEPQDARMRVRFRIDGVLHDVLALPDTMAPAILSRVKVMANMNIVERRRAQDGQITREVDGRSIDIRVSTSPMIWGEKAVLRLLDRNRLLFHLEDLGMSPKGYDRYIRMVKSPIGMVVCAGPTGSGKTTTLYATLTDINDIERNIITLEDPVEYVFPSINQIQINEQAGISFADGLRGILRQDPDVILVGEIRDPETAMIAVQSALTGHFVLSSLHATDAASALHRFLDMGVEPFLIASSVIGIVSQRLVRIICRHCRVPYHPSVDELALYDAFGGPPKDDFTHGEGCNFCSKTGYQSRTGVYEVMSVTDAVREILVDKGSPADIRKAALSEGMQSLQQEAIRLVAGDVTTLAEVARSMYTL